jgi:hypothetical protein
MTAAILIGFDFAKKNLRTAPTIKQTATDFLRLQKVPRSGDVHWRRQRRPYSVFLLSGSCICTRVIWTPPRPARAGRIQNRFVPVESFLNAAIWLRLRGCSVCAIPQFCGHDMLRVPKLTHSAVRDSSERAGTRRSPVRCEESVPTRRAPAAFGRCAGLTVAGLRRPPADKSVKSEKAATPTAERRCRHRTFSRLPEISLRKCDNRILAARRRAGAPQVCDSQQDGNCRHHDHDKDGPIPSLSVQSGSNTS